MAAQDPHLNDDYPAEAEQALVDDNIEANSPRRLSYGFAKRHGVVIKAIGDTQAVIGYRPGIQPSTLAELRRYLGVPLKLEEVSDPADFDQLLTGIYETGSSEAMQVVEGIGDDMDLARLAQEVPEAEELLESQDDAPIIRLINALFSQAIKENASDIHIESFENRVVVRFRVDGILHEVLQPQRVLAPLLVSRIKVMAKLDIAEKRVPQDGRIALRIAGRPVDVRVSTMPSSHGERVVLRLLDKQAGRLDLSHLGMPPATLKLMEEAIAHPYGIILVTGPTGSGKTTSLYAVLTELNEPTRNILTVEDPVEYYLSGIGQTQVSTKVGMTFARGLRAILRQDPDVVMIGEIRDLETAEIAVQASLTGHLVLSTLHTNTAIGSVTRLHDMGVEPFLLSSSLVALIAQRLVRLLCEHCKEVYEPDPAECRVLNIPEGTPPPTLYHPVGCDKCKNFGYAGRTGIYEVVLIDDQMRRLIHEGASEQAMTQYARTLSPSIRQDGMKRVLAGKTTLEEVLRVTEEGMQHDSV